MWPSPLGFRLVAPWALVLARASGLSWTAPGWGAAGLGWRIRLGLSLFLTAALGPVLSAEIAAPASVAELGRWCLAEAAVGAALGWSAALVVAGARQAGDLVGLQGGLAPASLLDPEADAGATPLGHLYGLVALGTFLALDGPWRVVAALIESYRVVPAGGPPLATDVVAVAFGLVGDALALALRLSAPAALAVAAAGLALGLILRSAAGAPLAGLALPLRSALAVALALLGLSALAAALGASWESWSVIEFR